MLHCGLRNGESEIRNPRYPVIPPKKEYLPQFMNGSTKEHANMLGVLSVLAREEGRRGGLSQRRKDAKKSED